MKIEKISDTQIRCTLNRADLLSREIKLSELAYGTEKAKNLFHDMIEQASNMFGFTAEDIPLMVEAIPVSCDCIVLVITKVEDPEELDTRFSRFTPPPEDLDFPGEDGPFMDMLEDIASMGPSCGPSEALEDISDGFVPMSETLKKPSDEKETAPSPSNTKEPIYRLFSFDSWKDASSGALSLHSIEDTESALYKDASGKYYLVVGGMCESDNNNNILNIFNSLCEFGKKEHYQNSVRGYLNEHCTLIAAHDALNILRQY